MYLFFEWMYEIFFFLVGGLYFFLFWLSKIIKNDGIKLFMYLVYCNGNKFIIVLVNKVVLKFGVEVYNFIVGFFL